MKGHGMLKKSDNSIGVMNTIIGKGTVLNGTLKVEQSVRIDGKIKGEVNATETLVVGKTGELQEAKVRVKNAVIGGKLYGTVEASNRIILENQSVLLGDIKARLLVIEEGATFSGNCDSGDQAQKKATLKVASDHTSLSSPA